MALLATVPMQSMAGDSKLGVSATLDHDPVTLIVDTGSQITVLDRAIVHSYARSGDHGFISGFGGSDGQSLVAMLDTGSPGTVVSRGAARRLGLTDAMLADDPIINGSGIGRRAVVGRLHRLGALSLGDLTISGLHAVVLPEAIDGRADLVLGLDIARRIL